MSKVNKVHAEIEYQKEDGTWVHSDICPSECSPDNIGQTVSDNDKVFVYRKYLHDCLDEWLDKSRCTGMFYIKDEKYKPDLYFGDEDGDQFTDTERLDWLEQRVLASGYGVAAVQGRNSSTQRTVILQTGVGSGPYQKGYEGEDLRAAIDKSMTTIWDINFNKNGKQC